MNYKDYDITLLRETPLGYECVETLIQEFDGRFSILVNFYFFISAFPHIQKQASQIPLAWLLAFWVEARQEFLVQRRS